MRDWECIAVLGPTCCWKSAVAMRLAQRLDAEIISCDSMQVYRHLDIGTAKPTAEDRAVVPHHLVDLLELDEPYDVNRFVGLAEKALTEIRQHGKVAIMAGGTGLYSRALIYGFGLLPAEPKVFKKYDDLSHEPGGMDRLVALLEAAAKQEGTELPLEYRQNPRRTIRGCEVLELTGQVPWTQQSKNMEPDRRFRQFCIVPVLATVKDRMRRRTRDMLEAGWVEETLEAQKRGLMETPTARQALGYGDILNWVKDGRPGGLTGLAEVLSNRTIQYARRQLTWFKHQHPGAVLLCPPEVDGALDWLEKRIVEELGL